MAAISTISDPLTIAETTRNEILEDIDFSTNPPTVTNLWDTYRNHSSILVSTLKQVPKMPSELPFQLIAEYAALEGLLVLNYRTCKLHTFHENKRVAMRAWMISQQSITKCQETHEVGDCRDGYFPGSWSDAWPDRFSPRISLHHLMNPDGTYKQENDRLFLTKREKAKDENGQETTWDFSIILTCVYVRQSDLMGKKVLSLKKCIEETLHLETRLRGAKHVAPYVKEAQDAAAKVVPGEYQDL